LPHTPILGMQRYFTDRVCVTWARERQGVDGARARQLVRKEKV